MNRKHFLSFAAAACALTLASQANAAAVIYSEDFSSPSVGSSWHIYAPGVDGWTSKVGDGVEIGQSSVYGLSCISWSGCQNIEINANKYGADGVTIGGLTVGRTYVLSYDYGVRSSGGPSSATVSFGGQTLTTDGVTNGHDWASRWYTESFNVVATATSETLLITGAATGAASYGNEYTNFKLVAAPETSTWAMMGLGFAGLGFAAFARRRGPVAPLD